MLGFILSPSGHKKTIINTKDFIQKKGQKKAERKRRKENPSKQTLTLTDGKPWRQTLKELSGIKVTSAQFNPICQSKVAIQFANRFALLLPPYVLNLHMAL
jgi:hypothetical protein